MGWVGWGEKDRADLGWGPSGRWGEMGGESPRERELPGAFRVHLIPEKEKFSRRGSGGSGGTHRASGVPPLPPFPPCEIKPAGSLADVSKTGMMNLEGADRFHPSGSLCISSLGNI